VPKYLNSSISLWLVKQLLLIHSIFIQFNSIQNDTFQYQLKIDIWRKLASNSNAIHVKCRTYARDTNKQTFSRPTIYRNFADNINSRLQPFTASQHHSLQFNTFIRTLLVYKWK